MLMMHVADCTTLESAFVLHCAVHKAGGEVSYQDTFSGAAVEIP